MSQPCGCCAGIQIITPEAEANPPGMSALKYRVGSYATFYESMLARLSTLSIDIPSADGVGDPSTVYPLKQLTTREPSDPAIALLDAWAIVADVLTFYQERIANEGYLATAIERRSLLELARLVSYTLRPGVSASVYLAFTVQKGFSGKIPAGTRAQSMPGSGQMPQFYETSADLDVSDAWNGLQPRLTRPQVITSAGVKGLDPSNLRTLYLQGLTTNLKIGDGLIITGDTQALRLIDGVTPQAGDQRTQIHFSKPPGSSPQTVNDVANSYMTQAASLFQGSGIADQVVSLLKELIGGTAPSAVVQNLEQLQSLAAARNLTRLGAWLADLLDDLNAAINASSTVAAVTTSSTAPTAVSPPSPLSALGQIDKILGKLALPPSLQPPSPISLPRTVATAFSPQSDIAPRLLAAFHPAAASTLYSAWSGITTPSSPAAVYATRVKAGIFANNFTGAVTVTQTEAVNRPKVSLITNTIFTLPILWDAVRDLVVKEENALTGLPLDAVYDQITVGSWVAILRPVLDGKGNPTGDTTITTHMVQSAQTVSRETVALDTDAKPQEEVPTGFTAKVTQLSLQPQWLSEITNKDGFLQALKSTALLRGTVIYAQAESLALAEEPLDSDVGGTTIELNGLYDGLESGRWVVVSGNRTDVPNTTVAASELVMIAGVAQGTTQLPGDTVHTTLTLANKGLAYSYDNSTVTIYANVAHATNGQSVGQVLGNGDGSQAFQTFALSQQPLTYLSAATPAGAQSTLSVTVNEIEWQETDDLGSLGPQDHGYVTLTDNSAKTSVIFGNGEHGARVPTGTANVKASYRYGIGSAGNADALQISQLATRPLGAQSVVNPLPASGGADADTPSQARSNTPLAVKALDRLVSIQDYADFSRSYAGIGKAASVKLSNGRRQVVYVTIAGNQDIPIDMNSDLYLNLVQSLQKFGDPHLPLLVGVRSVKLLVIIAGIQVLPEYQFEYVEPKVQAALLDAFSFEKRNLGQTAFLSEAISVMQAVAGVAFVNVTVFDSVPQSISATALAALVKTLVRRSHVQARQAYVNPPVVGQPSFQISPAELVYLTPDIPDTLILTEITPANPGPKVKLPRKSANPRWIRRTGGTQ